ncbi:hypothetical protein HPULCUR_004946 [Helicostylum pulchrum]|uniref:Uncharacterized protein n=1 Tax=Helicostylum pulchrum TaxID=562976 RepID=A0ABP9XXP2_9FUNG
MAIYMNEKISITVESDDVREYNRFATLDQNTTSSRITQVPASGRIHTNVIESIWRDLKSNISPRHRNKKDAPGKLLEHLWTVENRNNLIGGMFRMMKEVSFSSDNSNSGQFDPYMFTEAETGETPDEQLIREQREFRSFQLWNDRRHNFDINEEDEDDETNDTTYVEIPRRRRPNNRNLQ